MYILGYQIRSRHAILNLVSVTKPEEDESFDNIHTLLITSTSVMIISCVMEGLMYYLYNNKVYRRSNSININSSYSFFLVSSEERDCGKNRGGKQEEKGQR